MLCRQFFVSFRFVEILRKQGGVHFAQPDLITPLPIRILSSIIGFYLQKDELSMNSSISQVLANLFLNRLEYTLLRVARKT